jgi:hypothetical protein
MVVSNVETGAKAAVVLPVKFEAGVADDEVAQPRPVFMQHHVRSATDQFVN